MDSLRNGLENFDRKGRLSKLFASFSLKISEFGTDSKLCESVFALPAFIFETLSCRHLQVDFYPVPQSQKSDEKKVLIMEQINKLESLKIEDKNHKIQGEFMKILINYKSSEEPNVNKNSEIEFIKSTFGISIDESNLLPTDQKVHFQKVKLQERIVSHSLFLEALFKHELKDLKVQRFFWNGEVNCTANKIIADHINILSISESDAIYARWIAFVELQCHHPITLDVFHKLLDKILCENKSKKSPEKKKAKMQRLQPALNVLKVVNHLKKIVAKNSDLDRNQFFHLATSDNEIIELFWQSACKLFENFLKYIDGLHDAPNDIDLKVLNKMFEVIMRLQKIVLSSDIKKENFIDSIKESLKIGTGLHFRNNFNRDLQRLENLKSIQEALKEMTKIVKFVIENIKSCCEKFGSAFATNFSLNIEEVLHKGYDLQLAESIEPTIFKIRTENNDKKDVDTRKLLFEISILYAELKKFYTFFEINSIECKNEDYKNWFIDGMDKWREWSRTSDFNRIEKSIELDTLQPDSENVKFSSSAVDTMQTLCDSRNFWKNWLKDFPENHFVEQINVDLRQNIIAYFEKFIQKVKNHESLPNEILTFHPELEVTFGNFTYIINNLKEIVIENGMNHQLEQTKRPLRIIIEDFVGAKFENAHKNLVEIFTESAKDHLSNKTFCDNIVNYLSSYYDNLPKCEFQALKLMLWNQIMRSMDETIQNLMKCRRSHKNFLNLLNIFKNLLTIFEITTNSALPEETAKKVAMLENILEYHSMATPSLILNYYKNLYEIQQNIKDSPYGLLTIHASFVNEKLQIEILNARNLIPKSSSKKCSSYVKIQIIPNKFFPSCQNFKTKIQPDTNFPLFDETFECPLTVEQRNVKDAMIHFKIKDKFSIIGSECLAETFMPFVDVPELIGDAKLKQIHLKLSKTNGDDLETYKVLQHRSLIDDKEAKEFLTNLPKYSKSVKEKVKT